MNRQLTELVDHADAARAALLDVASAIPADRFADRPAPERWSAAELLEHLARVETGCARVIAKRAAGAREAGLGAETGDRSMLDALDGRGVTDRSRKLKAPEIDAPAGGFSRERALEALAASRAEFKRAVADADGLALSEVRHTHVVLGEIDLYQWILFVAQHEKRHTPQLEEIAEQLRATTP
jgi:uncharacterized damage-inducible protein DinB